MKDTVRRQQAIGVVFQFDPNFTAKSKSLTMPPSKLGIEEIIELYKSLKSGAGDE